jgi:hypothetical protein
MSETTRSELKRLIELLENTPAMAQMSSKSVDRDIREAYQMGYLQGTCLNVADAIRKLVK